MACMETIIPCCSYTLESSVTGKKFGGVATNTVARKRYIHITYASCAVAQVLIHALQHLSSIAVLDTSILAESNQLIKLSICPLVTHRLRP